MGEGAGARMLRVGTGTAIGGFRGAPRGTSELPRPGNLHAISFYNVDTSQIMTTLRGFCKRRNAGLIGARPSPENALRRQGWPCRSHPGRHPEGEPWSAGRSPSIFRFVYCEFFL